MCCGGALGLIFNALPVTVGVLSLVSWLTTVGTSGGAMSTLRLLAVSVLLLPAASLTLAETLKVLPWFRAMLSASGRVTLQLPALTVAV